MFHAFKIGVAAVSIMSFGLGAASAAVPLYGDISPVGKNQFKQDVSHYVNKCTFVRVSTSYGWKKVKRCKRVYPKHYNSY
jgi:hypothetical protein